MAISATESASQGVVTVLICGGTISLTGASSVSSAVVKSVLAGPESDLSEEPASGFSWPRWTSESPRVSFRACLHSGCVQDQLAVDGVGQAAFQASHRLVVSLAL
jgi:hypothetical protein